MATNSAVRDGRRTKRSQGYTADYGGLATLHICANSLLCELSFEALSNNTGHLIRSHGFGIFQSFYNTTAIGQLQTSSHSKEL